MGFRCERCGHEWVPRGAVDVEPKVCPNLKCKSPYWNKPRKTATSYEAFSRAIANALREAGKPITWTEIRTAAHLPQAFPNNKWVRRLESDIGLKRERDAHGIIHWHIESPSGLFGNNAPPTKASDQKGARPRRKQSALE
jgi:hypothetical protein